MAKISDQQRVKTQTRSTWSNLSGEQKMTSTDNLMFIFMLILVAVLFMVIYASRPPFQIS